MKPHNKKTVSRGINEEMGQRVEIVGGNKIVWDSEKAENGKVVNCMKKHGEMFTCCSFDVPPSHIRTGCLSLSSQYL